MVYFDHNATTPLLPEAREAWIETTDELVGNPSSPHRIGGRADAALERSRESIAAQLDCSPVDIVWTSGATEANNMVFHHAAATLPGSSEVWVSAVEHPSVISPARHHFQNRLQTLPVLPSGVIDLETLEKRLRDSKPGLIAVMAANNETGVIQPWAEVHQLCESKQIPFFCDAVQIIGKTSANGVGRCDFVSGSAHKFGGPKGSGFLKCPGALTPLLTGGPQESSRRAGTENVAGIVSMAAALETCASLQSSIHQRLKIRNQFEERLVKELPGSEVIGQSTTRLWNTVAALMPAADCQQRWVVKLDKLGFAVSTGSACSSGKEEPSHVLKAMNRTAEEASRVLRFSSGWATSNQDWDALLEALVKVNALQAA